MANTHVEIFHNYGHTCKERDLICARCILNIDSEPIIDTLKNTVNDFTQRLWFIWRFGEISCDGRFWKQISLTFVTWFENTFFLQAFKNAVNKHISVAGKKIIKSVLKYHKLIFERLALKCLFFKTWRLRSHYSCFQ